MYSIQVAYQLIAKMSWGGHRFAAIIGIINPSPVSGSWIHPWERLLAICVAGCGMGVRRLLWGGPTGSTGGNGAAAGRVK